MAAAAYRALMHPSAYCRRDHPAPGPGRTRPHRAPGPRDPGGPRRRRPPGRERVVAGPPTPAFVAPEWRGTWRRRAEQVAVTPGGPRTGSPASVWDDDRRLAVGRAGFHAAPDAEGTVEVGYAIDPAYRRRGYARAALASMIERARADPRVVRVLASVSPDNVASLGPVAQFGFVRIGEQWDDEDGLEWVFELRAG